MKHTTNYRPLLVAAACVVAVLGICAARSPQQRDKSAEAGRQSAPPAPRHSGPITLCQALGPAAPYSIWSVDSATGGGCGEVGWDSRGCGNWQSYAQGEYVGHARLPHVPEYRLRVGDQMAIYYLRTREVLDEPYKLEVGDMIRVESLTAGGGGNTGEPDDGIPGTGDLSRQVIVQPDGTITLPLLGQVHAAGQSIPTLRDELEKQYKKYYRVPAITVTAIRVDTRLEDLMETVDARGGNLGGRQLQVTVTPSGRINLPGVGSVYVQGLTLSEAKMEVDARYAATTPGVRITPDLTQRAQRYMYVLGHVQTPGQFELTGPTTTMQAIAMAGGWRVGANLRQVVVFRRADDWRLMATMVDLRGALYARRPVPADEIWLNDADIVLVPKNPIQMADEVVEQVFTRGIYAAVPLEVLWGQGFATVSTIISQQ
ncbi:polysaccharide biosynthesis/export family protein [Aeoliella sp. ICT_H6.2]|uniref:Polysaccharide biosynthesis/export family protein n=1 Tax=Aeoliella straminimaris TaxID=2954799 RepID=A0A9X2FG68_9BACT|nr:polysaccharide biosynthesis/export family protein [Aeoliella straminimaris]MCO6043636.1 polysaccharide biosynthesis/export family protein [Aeoliella straminimaris]